MKDELVPNDILWDSEVEQDCQILEDFLRRKDEVKLPSLDANGYPFHNQHLYWPKPRDNGDEGQIQDVAE